MMEVSASAAGKLVLLGDYAVLEGAPALVMAVNRKARVRIVAKAGSVAEVSAPDMNIGLAQFKIGADGKPEWLCSAEDAARLRLVDQTLRGLLHEGLAPPPGRAFSLHLDTSEFFDTGVDGRAKLGLGSSAALTVALASAMAVFVGRGPAVANRRVWLEHLLQLHREFQGGHGSGVDVAAGLIGGVISYRLLEGGAPRFEPVQWPAAVKTLFVWSGKSASTSNFLDRLAQWRSGHGAEYAAQMRGLGEIAGAAAEAAMHNRSAALVDAAGAYASALRAFGNACGLEIFSPEHIRLTELSAAAGVGYKPCGAGGGDFGVVFTLDPERLAQAERSITAAGFRCVPLAIDEQGLQLEYTGF
jgi:phosphomevalonate kinase